MKLPGKWSVRLLILGVCVAILAWQVGRLGPRRVLREASGADPGFLLLSVLAAAGRYLVWGAKWTAMLRRQGSIRYGVALRALLAGAFVNLTTPTAKLAGGFLRAGLVHRRTGWGLAVAYGWALADQITNLLANLGLAGGLLLGAALTSRSAENRRLFLGIGLCALGLVAACVSLRAWASRQTRRPGPVRLLARLTPARFRAEGPAGQSPTWLEPVLAPLLRVGTTWKVAPLDLGLAAASTALLCASNALALKAVGVEAPPFQTAAAMVLAGFAGTVTGTMGGVGATELALIGLYTRMGIATDAATAAVLLHRAAYYLITLILGSVALVWEGPWRERVSA